MNFVLNGDISSYLNTIQDALDNKYSLIITGTNEVIYDNKILKKSEKINEDLIKCILHMTINNMDINSFKNSGVTIYKDNSKNKDSKTQFIALLRKNDKVVGSLILSNHFICLSNKQNRYLYDEMLEFFTMIKIKLELYYQTILMHRKR